MYTLGKYLMKQGFIIGIMADKDVVEHDYFVSRFKEEGFRIFVMPIPGKGYKLNNIPRSFTTLIRFFKIINRYKPDLIHVHWRVTSFYDHLAYKFLGIPYIVTLHSVGIPSNFLARKLSFWGQYAIAISKETYLDLKYKFKIPQSKIKIIYNGVDDSYFYPPNFDEKRKARQELGLSEDDNVVCLIGHLSKVKGHDILIKASKILEREGIKVKYLLAGSGDFDYIKELIKQYEVEEQFILTGFVDSRKILWASDILVLPSRKEGFPLVIIEAMLCKVVPIRTPAAGAYDQIDDGINGFIIPFEDPYSLANRIKILIEDKELREKMADRAFEKAKKLFTIEMMAKSYIDIYNEIINFYKKNA